MNARENLIRSYFETFIAADRARAEAMLSADFTFTSPQDDHIDRATYFERCWPAAGHFEKHDFRLILAGADDAVVHYDAVIAGKPVRNVERFSFDGDLIRAVEVFFGKPADAPVVAPEAAIRTVLSQRKDALEVKDARLVAAKHAPGCVTFSLAPPLVAAGDPVKGLEAWFKSWEGPISWETRDPQINVSGDVAFVTALEHMRGTKADGTDADLWFRATLGLTKHDGEWKISHEHQSVPFYMDGSNEAALDLTPDSDSAHSRHFDQSAAVFS